MSRRRDIRNPEYIAKKLNISLEEARSVIQYDAEIEATNKKTELEKSLEKKGEIVKKEKKKKAGSITEEELDKIIEIVAENFGLDAFQNIHLSPYLLELGLTIRQTPSRLTRLVEIGKLVEVDKEEVKMKRSQSKAFKINPSLDEDLIDWEEEEGSAF